MTTWCQVRKICVIGAENYDVRHVKNFFGFRLVIFATELSREKNEPLPLILSCELCKSIFFVNCHFSAYSHIFFSRRTEKRWDNLTRVYWIHSHDDRKKTKLWWKWKNLLFSYVYLCHRFQSRRVVEFLLHSSTSQSPKKNSFTIQLYEGFRFHASRFYFTFFFLRLFRTFSSPYVYDYLAFMSVFDRNTFFSRDMFFALYNPGL